MQQEPVAIIGIGCRLPGKSNSADEYWDMLCGKTDAVIPITGDRFNVDTYYHPKQGMEGKTYCKWGGLVDDFDKFDPGFFGMSRREGDFVDPQQRMLLEASWRALEDGREVIDLARGSNVGVFTGISTLDYHLIQSWLDPSTKSDIFSATGSVHSIAANRISYALNLSGPSMALDTACSSALIAIHTACESLLNGDCEMALAGGVNSIHSPNPYLIFCKMSMLSPTGRCHPFDSRADGFVRGEGAGMILLKPLSAAIRDGNRIYATILATASNQDGRTNGLTVPNPTAQENLIKTALKRAGVKPKDVDYMEAHGTGTPIGDPIEAHALGRALGEGRSPANPCAIGSVKGNIGHLEAGAGAAGIIKAALALYHRSIPPTLNHKKGNPNIDFDDLKLRVVTEQEDMPDGKRLPLAAVNSFGFGGANAHAILQAAPEPQRKFCRISKKASDDESVDGLPGLLMPLSAGTQEGVRAAAGQMHEILVNDEKCSPASLCLAAGVERVNFQQRAAVVAKNRTELIERLDALSKEEGDPGVFDGAPLSSEHPGPVFVFSGQGPQWYAMGRGLIRSSKVFRDVIERCDLIMSQWGDWSLLEELRKPKTKSRIQETAIAQPAIFAVQAALAELWKSWGIKPVATVGHSVGEVAAAYVSGVLTLEEACRVIFWRGACMDATDMRGRMLAASLSEEDAAKLVSKYKGKVHLAAFNGPESVTLSGDSEPLQEIAALLESKGTFNRFLRVGYAFHSHHMDDAQGPLLKRLGKIIRSKPVIPVYSTVTGKLADDKTFDAEYWWLNVREPVRFSQAIDGLIDSDYRLFVEMSAHPVLSASIGECLDQASQIGGVVPTLERNVDDSFSISRALGKFYILGGDIDWEPLYPKVNTIMGLPPLPFLMERHWSEPTGYEQLRVGDYDHPILQRRSNSADPTWDSYLSLDVIPFLREHVVQDHPVFPAAGFLECATAAARQLNPGKPVKVENVEFAKALFLPEGSESTVMQLAYDPTDSNFTIGSRGVDGSEWSSHVKGRFLVDSSHAPNVSIDMEALRKTAGRYTSGEGFYSSSLSVGFYYGPRFRGVQGIYHHDGSVFVDIEIGKEVQKQFKKYYIPPELLDSVLQPITLAAPREYTLVRETGFLPVRCGSYRIFTEPRGRRYHALIDVTHAAGKTMRCNILILDGDENLVAELRDMEVQGAVKSKSMRATTSEECLYVNRWLECSLDEKANYQADEVDQMVPVPDWAHLDADQQRSIRSLNLALNRTAGQALNSALKDLGKSPLSKVKAGLRDQVGALAARLSVKDKAAYAEFPFEALLNKYPSAYPEILFLERVLGNLNGLLRGRKKLADVLEPGGSISLEEHLLQDGESLSSDHARMRRSLRNALSNIPDSTPLNVLVVGAGTGSAVAELLPEFDPAVTRVVYAEPDEKRSSMAEQKFFDFPFVEYLNKELPNAKERNSFDLIIHLGGGDEGLSLAYAKKLLRCLKSDGLCLFEASAKRPLWMDLCYSLDAEVATLFLPGKWEKMESVLLEAGFVDTSASKPSASGTLLAAARGPSKKVKRTKTEQFSLANLRYTTPKVWIGFADDKGVLEKSLKQITENSRDSMILVHKGDAFARKGEHAYQVKAGDLKQIARLFRSLRKRFAMEDMRIAFGWGMDLPDADHYSNSTLAKSEALGAMSLLGIAKAMPPTSGDLPAELALMTCRAQAVKEGAKGVNPISATVVGIGRSLQAELQGVRVRMIDVGNSESPSELRMLADELSSNTNECEVALRGRKRHILRFSREELARGKKSNKNAGYRLDVLNPGMLDSITFIETLRRKPGKGEVEISVKAAAMNFRDVMKALGIYPSDAEVDRYIGDECSGIVERVGPGVKGWKVGDKVMALGVGCFASHITMPASGLMPMPKGLSFSEAATLPVAYMTSVYSLCQIANLKKGETVLIQAGSGGVGVAAIHLAKSIGARVFATAGNDEKRGFLRSLGVDEVFDSRSLSFADGVREATGGRGVDVVLNSLAGLAIEKGLECLAPYGRFVEIGKRDIYANTPIGLRPLRNNVSMTVVDLGQAMNDGGAMLGALLKDVLERINRSKLPALPHRTFPMNRARDAFRCMAQARHIGKIVMATCGHVESKPRPRLLTDKGRRTNIGAFIVTGGLSGFGMETTKFLINVGVDSVWAVSRSGKGADDDALYAMAERQGVTLHIESVDVTSKASVNALIRKIHKQGVPLRGIIHSAMVLDDKTMARMTPEQMTRVLAPKVLGTWNLHEATLNEPLESFTMYSSVSSILGNAGQGNYAAANAFLDAMAHYRRSLGLPAMTVNWGQLGGVGVAAENDKLRESLTRQGIIPLPVARAIGILQELGANDHVQTGAIPIEWQAFLATHPQLREISRYQEVMAGVDADGADAESISVRQTIIDTPAARRRVVMMDMLKEEVAKVLRTSVAKIREDRPLSQLGLDSLMSFELLMRIESMFELSLPPTRMKPGTTISDLSEFLLELITGGSGADSSSQGSGASAGDTSSTGSDDSVSLSLPEGSMVDLRKNGNQAPLFVLHPAGGLVGIYDSLVAQLPENLPVIGIQSRVFYADGGEFLTLDTMAKSYAHAIMRRQPEGSIRLLGFSFGSHLATAIAAELEKIGRHVSWIGQIDPIEKLFEPDASNDEELVKWHLRDFAIMLAESYQGEQWEDMDLLSKLNDLWERVHNKTPDERAVWLKNCVNDKNFMKGSVDARLMEFLLMLHYHQTDIARAHKGTTVNAPIHIWRGSHQWAGASGDTSASSAGVVEDSLPVNHFEFFTGENPAIIAKAIADALSEKKANRKKRPVQV